MRKSGRLDGFGGARKARLAGLAIATIGLLGAPATAGATTTQAASTSAQQIARAAQVAEGASSPVQPLWSTIPNANQRALAPTLHPLAIGDKVNDPAVLLQGAAGAAGFALPTEVKSRDALVAPDNSVVADDDTNGPDAAVQQLDGRIRLQTVVEDASTNRVSYPFALSTGLRLQALPNGGIEILDASGARFASVAPPWAVDAAGHKLVTRYEIGAGVLTQVIDGLATAKLPVVADPAIENLGINSAAGALAGAVIANAPTTGSLITGGLIGIVGTIGLHAATPPKVVVKAPPKTPITIKGKPGGNSPRPKPPIKVGAAITAGGYKTFKLFKKDYGPAGTGKVWHHIVEQSSKFKAELTQNANNLVRLAETIHTKCVNSFMSRRATTAAGKAAFARLGLNATGPNATRTVREAMRAKYPTFGGQHRFGVNLLAICGFKV